MQQWDGIERRHTQSEMQELLKQVRADVASLTDDVAKLTRCFNSFRDKYESHLEKEVQARKDRIALNKEIQSSIIKSFVIASAIFIAGIFAIGAKGWIIEWLGK